MIAKKNFGIIGGDFRQIYLAKKFHGDGNTIFLYGFDKLKPINEFLYPENIYEVIKKCDYIVFPIPITRDRLSINAPLSKNSIIINSQILNLLHTKIVFGDLSEFMENDANCRFYDYSKNEDFQILNAIPTAEGSLQTALSMQKQTLFKSKCLITGFGRIGKVLANRLEKFNADITISDRDNVNLVWAYTLGYNSVALNKIADKLQNYDFIFNTIPHQIFDETMLSKCNKNVAIIDISSTPGGIDKIAAEKLNINYRHELAIPGRMFPKTAANIIYYSIKKIIEEKNL